MLNPAANHPINANTPPQAKIVFQALDKVYQARQVKNQKAKMKVPLQVNRPHTFSHAPYSVAIKPLGEGSHF